MRVLVLGLLVMAAAAACTDAPSKPSANVPLATIDLKQGLGLEAQLGSVMTVNYTGWLFDASRPDSKGPSFDTSLGQTPFTFTLGAGQVIKGWDQGLQGMRVGGIRRVIVPPNLAYGDVRAGAIPPGSTLLFDVELLSIAQ